jgi:DNA-directed RNA polymerase specialized sigma24 family protein
MPSDIEPSTSIVRQLMERRNTEENFRWVFEKYHSAVAGFFFRKGFSSEDCRGLTQEVFMAVWAGIGKLRSETAFLTWLFSISHHTAIRHMERQGISVGSMKIAARLKFTYRA